MRWILFLFCAGCFPYRETYRPVVDGVLVDEKGAALANVRVESCSATHWDARCRYRGNTITDGSGHFHFKAIKEWDWCCLGEAPLPYTVFAACRPDGKIATGRVENRTEPLSLTLAGAKDEWARRACASAD